MSNTELAVQTRARTEGWKTSLATTTIIWVRSNNDLNQGCGNGHGEARIAGRIYRI